jgi:DNA-binding LytR/AlgR family response regulator
MVYFQAPLNDLQVQYMVKKKTINVLATTGDIFYTYELSNTYNSENEINYFDNQRAKANGNISSNDYITRNIDIDNIVYVEADKRYTNIRTNEDNYLCNESISSLEERLPKRFFFRTHRTYILNFKHISGINDCLIEMDNGEFVILSRHKKAEFDKAYTAYKRSENKHSQSVRIGA